MEANWFHDKRVAEIFASHLKRTLVYPSFETCGGKAGLPMLFYDSGQTRNLLPSYGYASLPLRCIGEMSIASTIDELRRMGVTAAFLPVRGPPPNWLVGSEMYAAKLPSYNLNLLQSEGDLRRNVSRRRRSKLTPRPDEGVEFITDDKARLVEPFIEYYGQAMTRLGAAQRFVFGADTLARLCALETADLVGVAVRKNIEMVMLHGRSGRNVEFVFSGASDAGQGLATMALWHAAQFYKAQSMERFHLGGGVRPNDGLDNFKRQFGGDVMQNGGIKLVVDQMLFEDACRASGHDASLDGFFPAYLREAVLGSQTK